MNKKMLISIALLILMILNCALPVVVNAGDNTAVSGDVEITLNGNLYEAIKSNLMEQEILATYKDAQRTILVAQSEIDRVTNLNLSNYEIDDLKGLDIFKKVTSVDLSANKLTQESSLEVLSSLPLEFLDLSSNEIEDISAISNFDQIKETNLHNQKFTDVQIITVEDPNLGFEASEVMGVYHTQLPQVLSQAGILKSEWLIDEVFPYENEPIRIDWASFNPGQLDMKIIGGSEFGPYEGMIKLSIKITDPNNNLYNSDIKIFFVVVRGEERGIIFKDKNLYEATKAQLEEGQYINEELMVYTDERTLYRSAYDEPMVLVININTLINEITSLKLDNYQIEDLSGIEKFVGLTNELDISFNYIDTLEKVFALVDEKLIEEEILRKKFDVQFKQAEEFASKIKKNFEAIRDAEAQMIADANQIQMNNARIATLQARIAELEATTTAAEETIATAKADIEAANTEIETNNEQIENAKKTIETLKDDLKTAKDRKTALEKEISDATRDMAGTTDATLIANYQAIIDNATAELAEVETSITTINTNITTEEANIKTYEANVKAANDIIKTANETIAEAEKDPEYSAKKAEIDAAKKEIEKLSADNVKLADTSDDEEKIAKAEAAIATLKGDFITELHDVYYVYAGYYNYSSVLTQEVFDLEYNDEYKSLDLSTKVKMYKAQLNNIKKMYDNLDGVEKMAIKWALNIPDYAYDENGKLVEDPIQYTLEQLIKQEDEDVTGVQVLTAFRNLEVADEFIKLMNYCENKKYFLGTTTDYSKEYVHNNIDELLQLSFALMMWKDDEINRFEGNPTVEDIMADVPRVFRNDNYGYNEPHLNTNGYTDNEYDQINYLYYLFNQLAEYAGYSYTKDVDDRDVADLERLVNSILRIKDANGDEDRFIFIPDLKRLNAECNLIETVEGLEKLETAIDIILRDNEIVDINCVDWSKFTRLEILDLARNAISDIKALNNLPRIEILDLDSNLIEGRVELDIYKFDYIQEVDFSENKITDIEYIMTQYIFIARDKGCDSVAEYLELRDTVKIYFYKQILNMNVEIARDDSIVYIDLPLIFRQIEEISPRPTTFGLYSAIGNVTNDGKRVMLDVSDTGDNYAYVEITSSHRYGRSLGEGTMLTIEYLVPKEEVVENVVENTTENIVDNTVSNAVDNTVNNTVDNTVDNTVNNTVDNTVNNTVDNTVNNTVDNTVNNTVDNTVNNKPSTDLGYTVKGEEIVGVSPDTDIEKFVKKLTEDYKVEIKTEDGKVVTEGNVATGMLVVLYDENNKPTAAYELVVKGDVNGDGSADAVDSRLIKAHRADKQILEDVYSEAADIDGDGKITAIDSRLLLYHRAEVSGYIL